jgi:putative membrane protein
LHRLAQEVSVGLELPKSQHVTEHLANERTVLAWVRTSIAVMTFGVAINRFSLFLQEFHLESHIQQSANRHVERLGIGLVALGVAIMVGAASHYLHVANTIDRGIYRPQRFMIIAVATAVVVFGGTSLVWLFTS